MWPPAKPSPHRGEGGPKGRMMGRRAGRLLSTESPSHRLAAATAPFHKGAGRTMCAPTRRQAGRPLIRPCGPPSPHGEGTARPGGRPYKETGAISPPVSLRSTAPSSEGAKENTPRKKPPSDDGGGICEANDGGRDRAAWQGAPGRSPGRLLLALRANSPSRALRRGYVVLLAPSSGPSGHLPPCGGKALRAATWGRPYGVSGPSIPVGAAAPAAHGGGSPLPPLAFGHLPLIGGVVPLPTGSCSFVVPDDSAGAGFWRAGSSRPT